MDIINFNNSFGYLLRRRADIYRSWSDHSWYLNIIYPEITKEKVLCTE